MEEVIVPCPLLTVPFLSLPFSKKEQPNGAK